MLHYTDAVFIGGYVVFLFILYVIYGKHQQAGRDLIQALIRRIKTGKTADISVGEPGEFIGRHPWFSALKGVAIVWSFALIGYYIPNWFAAALIASLAYLLGIFIGRKRYGHELREMNEVRLEELKQNQSEVEKDG